jgi:hypothetical protein
MVTLMVFRMQKGRPPQLSLSPSDPALAATARSAPVEQQRNAEEDRGVMSDVGYCPALSFSEANKKISERNQKLCENGPRASVWSSKLVIVDGQVAIASQVQGSHVTTLKHRPIQRWRPISTTTTQT